MVVCVSCHMPDFPFESASHMKAGASTVLRNFCTLQSFPHCTPLMPKTALTQSGHWANVFWMTGWLNDMERLWIGPYEFCWKLSLQRRHVLAREALLAAAGITMQCYRTIFTWMQMGFLKMNFLFRQLEIWGSFLGISPKLNIRAIRRGWGLESVQLI